MASNLTVLQNAEAAKVLSQLRDLSLKPAAVRSLVAKLTATMTKQVIQPLEDGEQIAVVVVMRSGLAMLDSFLAGFSDDADVVVYHLGLFRERHTLRPVEYYNKLPPKNPRIKRAYILDPLVATGGTARAAFDILKDWGVDHITLFSLLGSEVGLNNVSGAWTEGIEVFTGAVDKDLDSKGYVKPGVGDIGDRLYGTALG